MRVCIHDNSFAVLTTLRSEKGIEEKEDEIMVMMINEEEKEKKKKEEYCMNKDIYSTQL